MSFLIFSRFCHFHSWPHDQIPLLFICQLMVLHFDSHVYGYTIAHEPWIAENIDFPFVFLSCLPYSQQCYYYFSGLWWFDGSFLSSRHSTPWSLGCCFPLNFHFMSDWWVNHAVAKCQDPSIGAHCPTGASFLGGGSSLGMGIIGNWAVSTGQECRGPASTKLLFTSLGVWELKTETTKQNQEGVYW